MQPREYYANSFFIAQCQRCVVLTRVIENKVCCGTQNKRHNDLYTKEVF